MADQRGTTALVVQLLLILAGTASAQFKLSVVVPIGTTTAATADFTGVKEILSVTSPVPHLFMGSKTDPKNRITLQHTHKGKTLKCKLPMVVIGKKPDGTTVTYTGEVDVTPINLDDVKQAVTVAGDIAKLNELVTKLKATYDVVIVSQNPAAGGKPGTISVVLKEKASATTIPKDQAEKIIENLLKTDTALTSLEIQRPDCYSTCKDICGSVLTVDSSGNPTKPVQVTSETGNFYGTLKTKLEHKCGKDYLKDIVGVCVPSSTCANGGTCRAGPSGTSPSLCSCKPDLVNEVYGPNCQLLTRSYESSGPSDSAITHHGIPASNTYSYKLDLSFQHTGKCTLTSGTLCTILKLDVGGKEVLKVEQGRMIEPHYTSATLPVKPTDDSKMGFFADRYVQNQRWMDVTVSVVFNSGGFTATAVFCSKEVTSACFSKTATGSSSAAKQAKGKLSIGGTFNGCFRNVRVNGPLVDLKVEPTSITGDAGKTHENCGSQDASCRGSSGGSKYTCGDNSVCYGQLGSKTGDMNCGCRCTNERRMTNELITRSTQCAVSCNQETPIVSTGSSSSGMNWAMLDGSHIRVHSGSSRAPITLLLRFRTSQSAASDMLKINFDSGEVAELKIQSEVLVFCIKGTCHPFIPIPVNNNKWHEVFVSAAHQQLVTRVDDYARIHNNVASISSNGVKVSMNLPSSCISNVRVSDIYMPTGDSDTTKDSSSASVRASFGSGVKTGNSC